LYKLILVKIARTLPRVKLAHGVTTLADLGLLT